MKKIITSLLILSCLCINAQKITETSYSGIITLENGILLSFEMEITEQEGLVSGFSITGHGTENETKSDISGTYNKKENRYNLRETQILETQSEAPISSFCYINMQIQETGKLATKRMQGDFIGYFNDGRRCSSGRVILIEKKRLEKTINNIKKKVNKKKKKEKEKTVLSTKVLGNGEEMKIYSSYEKISIYIWDASSEDGDKIDLIINDDKILEEFETKRKRKKVKYKLHSGQNTIKITAVNLGIEPPNTSRIEIRDGKTKYPIITQLELNKSAIITIIR